MIKLIITVTPYEQTKLGIEQANLAAQRFQKSLVGYCSVKIQEEESKGEVIDNGRDF